MANAFAATKRPLRLLRRLHRHDHHRHSAFHSESPLQHSIRTAIETNNHHQIPHLLLSSSNPNPIPNHDDNPFSFLSSLPPTLTARIVDDVLQSFIPLRPRSLTHPAYAALLSLTLPDPDHHSPADTPSVLLPLALAVLQTSIRSGFSPPPQTRLSLSLAWLHLRRRHHHPKPASRLLSSMREIGYRPDLRTCNYLISSLCSASETEEAIVVLRGMSGAGCGPDSESYCTVIEACCCRDGRWAATGEELLREMVAGEGMTPRKGTVGRVVAAMRKEGEARRAAEVVRFLESEGCAVGFEEYEAAAEGCVESGEFVVAGKVVVEMAERGFIPYIKVRQRVVEGLAGIGQLELASAVRQRLAEIRS